MVQFKYNSDILEYYKLTHIHQPLCIYYIRLNKLNASKYYYQN